MAQRVNDNIIDHFHQNANIFMLKLYSNYQAKFKACHSIEKDATIINEYCNR